ncbi:MAG: hypothetical protein QNL04_13795 [SAR324 cluster bacterium]|nr:hypothetical protein [SAR324 cluster bacterium]
MKKTFLFILLLNLLVQSAFALFPDRRKEQFPGEPAYYLVPFPYEYPGIGSGFIFMGSASNMFGSRADVTVGQITGDVTGSIAAVSDVFLIPNFIYVSAQKQQLDTISIQNYSTRGMDSQKDDFTFIEVTELDSLDYQVNLTLWERRIELYQQKLKQNLTVAKIRDSEGALIANLTEPYMQENEGTMQGVTLDLTDDRQDARKGIRLKMEKSESPRADAYSADFYQINKTVEFYIPIGQRSTWAFHGFRSDAIVRDEGVTDSDTLLEILGLTCETGDTVCEATQDDLVQQFADQNKNGTAASLGGLNQLRSYGSGRFSGGHTQYVSTELRINLTEEFTPLNYWIWSDTRTGVQAAFFYETGTVAETEAELGNESRSSAGAGLRMVTGSGFVYRVDVATGSDGTVPIIWFYYPW